MKLSIATCLIAFGTTCLASDEQFDAPMQAYLEDHILGWASDPNLISAIIAQNSQTNGYTQDQIDNMDRQWRGEVGTPFQPMVDALIDNSASQVLRQHVSSSEGAVTEVFIMDARGLNVAASIPTSDLWQGDEDKHIQTYLMGSGAVHFGDIEYDDSTETVQGQISVTIVDSSGAPIGAMTVGIDLMELM